MPPAVIYRLQPRLCLLSALLGFWIVSVWSSRAERVAPDFSAGFQQLLALGIADTKDCIWAETTEFTEQGKRGSVTGWWSAERKQFTGLHDDEPRPVCPAAEVEELEQEWEKLDDANTVTRAEYDRLNLKRTDLWKRGVLTIPKPASLAKAMSVHLKYWEKQTEKEDAYSYQGRGGEVIDASSSLKFACQAWRAGATAEANALALAVLSKSEDAETALDEVIDRLGDEALATVTDAFFKTHDWQAYAKGLHAVTEKFSRGWQVRSTVIKFHEHLAKRAELKTPAPVALPDGLNTPEHQTLLARLVLEAPFVEVAEPDQDPALAANDSRTLWFLQLPSQKRWQGPLAEILAKGIEAIPLLAAVAEDHTLGIESNSDHSNSAYPFDSDGNYLQSSSAPFPSGFPRPAVRSEIVQPWLDSIVPSTEEEFAPPLGARALSVYAALKGKTAEEILWYYLQHEHSDANQQREAVALLAKGADPELHKLETWLEKQPALASMSLAESYLTARGAAGRAYLESLTKRAQEEIQDESKREASEFNYGSLKATRQRLDQKLAELKQLLRSASLPELLADIAQGSESLITLRERIAKLTADAGEKEVNEILAAARTATAVGPQAQLLTLLMQVRRSRITDEKFAAWLVNTPEKRGYWEKLLSDHRLLTPGEGAFYGRTLGQYAAAMFDFMHWLEKDSEDLDQAAMIANYYIRGEDFAKDPMMQRAQQRLAGTRPTELMVLPITEKERQTELLKVLKGTAVKEFPTWLGSLTKSEQVYLWKEYGPKRTFPTAWRDSASTIAEVTVAEGAPWAKSYDWQSLVNQAVDEQWVTSFLEAIKPKSLAPGSVMIESNATHSALRLRCGPPLSAADFKAIFPDGQAQELCVCAFRFTSGRTVSFPLAEDAPEEPEGLDEFYRWIKQSTGSSMHPGSFSLYLAVRAEE